MNTLVLMILLESSCTCSNNMAMHYTCKVTEYYSTIAKYINLLDIHIVYMPHALTVGCVVGWCLLVRDK